MAVFNISELIQRLKEIQSDGFKYVELSIFDEDENFPSSIEFEAFDPIGENASFGISYDGLNAVDIESL